jgi:CopG family transcriptional regulator, nickel-responsive regulator
MERFTISLDDRLAHDFDELIAARGYANRSEAVRDLLRAELERTRQHNDESVHCVACLSYVFNHHQRELTERIVAIQHDHHDLAVSTMHVHLDHDHCLETVILRGATHEVRQFADAVCAERGVHHGKLNLISVDVHQAHTHEHGHSHVHLASPAARAQAGARAKKAAPGTKTGTKPKPAGKAAPHVHYKPAS